MPVALLNLCVFLSVLNIDSAVSVCDITVQTINFGCHLEWECPDVNSKTTYTVLSKAHDTSWVNVSGCIQISRKSCDLSHVFSSLNSYNFIRLTSELLSLNETLDCDPINDSAAKFSLPSITLSLASGSLWVTVNFPCSPSVSCLKKESSEEEEEEMGCSCPLTEFKNLEATVTLYNKQNLSDGQEHTAQVVDETPFKVEFGFLKPGQVYCVVANFTVEGVLASSPPSIPQCVYIPENNESLIVVIVCAVLLALGLVFLLVWRRCELSEHPLPRSLALLQDLELQKETFIDLSKVQNESSEGDHVSVVSFSGFTLVDNQSYYNTQSLGDGYYTSPILHNPDCTEQSEESEELSTEVQHDEFHLLPSHPSLETEVGCPYQNQNHLLSPRDIPLSSVRVEHTQVDETSTEDPERCEDVMWGKLNMRPGEDIQGN